MEKNYSENLAKVIDSLTDDKSYNMAYFPHLGNPMPSSSVLTEVVDLLRRILFPGYFGNSTQTKESLGYYLGVNTDRVFHLLKEQIRYGFCFECETKGTSPLIDELAPEITLKFMESLPKIRELISTDVKAAYDGDPAASSYGQIIYCYPTIRMIMNHRIAHELLRLGVPLIPRIISEMAHSETGIDIHPGAEIGEGFFIDHGTGVVIGETCIIGKNVKLYQGVTLGAKSFPLDEDGNPIKGIPRHPVVEDNVVIYSQATILGRITVGHDSMIGGNVWVTNNVEPYSKILQNKPREMSFVDGGGI